MLVHMVAVLNCHELTFYSLSSFLFSDLCLKGISEHCNTMSFKKMLILKSVIFKKAGYFRTNSQSCQLIKLHFFETLIDLIVYELHYYLTLTFSKRNQSIRQLSLSHLNLSSCAPDVSE